MNTVKKGVGAVILAAALASSSPGLLGAQEADPSSTEPVMAESRTTAELFVENNGWFDVHLYMVRAGQRTSLGFLTALGTGEFELPSAASMPGAHVQILVDPIGGASYLTPGIIVNGGDAFGLVIQNHLPLSNLVALTSS